MLKTTVNLELLSLHVVRLSTGVEILIGFMSREREAMIWLMRKLAIDECINPVTQLFDPVAAVNRVLPMKDEEIPHWTVVIDIDAYFAEKDNTPLNELFPAFDTPTTKQ